MKRMISCHCEEPKATWQSYLKDCATTLIFLLMIPASVSFAGNMFPVQSVSLSYDLEKSTLHVDAAHPSDNWEIDYVRMMTVAVNGQVVSTNNYAHQTLAQGLSEDVQVNAQPGDVISVTVYSTQGNSVSQDLTVTKPGA